MHLVQGASILTRLFLHLDFSPSLSLVSLRFPPLSSWVWLQDFLKLPLRCPLRHIQRCNLT